MQIRSFFTDGKTVPFYHDGDAAVVNRVLQLGDRFNLWEWADHMLSQSSNSAGSMVWKQVMLIRKVRKELSTTEGGAGCLSQKHAEPELTKLALAALDGAAGSVGIDTSRMRLGRSSTRNGSNVIPAARVTRVPTTASLADQDRSRENWWTNGQAWRSRSCCISCDRDIVMPRVAGIEQSGRFFLNHCSLFECKKGGAPCKHMPAT
jgi:hypothetical protein